MRRGKISLDEYNEFCSGKNICPSYHPSFIEFYFAQVGKRPQIVGLFNNEEQLIAAYPVLYGQIFPNPLHKRLLGEKYRKVGDIGQPEALFPMEKEARKINLNCFSPVTSPILREKVRGLGGYSLRTMAIGKERSKKQRRNCRRLRNRFYENKGVIHFTDDLDPKDFSDEFLRLYSIRWGISIRDLQFIAHQIIKLYTYVFGCLLVKGSEPVAAFLGYQHEGSDISYIDGVLAAVKKAEGESQSYGTILYYTMTEKSEAKAESLGKQLRFSYGYLYGNDDYKKIWAKPEKTFIGF